MVILGNNFMAVESKNKLHKRIIIILLTIERILFWFKHDRIGGVEPVPKNGSNTISLNYDIIVFSHHQINGMIVNANTLKF